MTCDLVMQTVPSAPFTHSPPWAAELCLGGGAGAWDAVQGSVPGVGGISGGLASGPACGQVGCRQEGRGTHARGGAKSQHVNTILSRMESSLICQEYMELSSIHLLRACLKPSIKVASSQCIDLSVKVLHFHPIEPGCCILPSGAMGVDGGGGDEVGEGD